jgi:RecB family endonuclease NucS
LHELEYDRFDYNMRLGAGLDPGDAYPPEIRRMAIMNSQKRLDAVGYQGNVATIIEAKRRAGLSNIGQLVGYRVLWMRDHPDWPAPRLLLVASSIQADLYDIALHENIGVEIVSVDFSSLRVRSQGGLSGHKHA